jgi:8-oxo-dGTP pyrophosphatase MutT (NUDIX family)
MEKFSKMKPMGEEKPKSDEILYDDKYMKVIKYEDWSVIDDKDVVVCIPYLIESNQIVLRQEYIPSFKLKDGQEYHISLVGGSVEMGETLDECLLRELQEESGIVLRDNFKIEFMKPLFKTKSHSAKFHPCILTLTENDYHEIKINDPDNKLNIKNGNKLNTVIKVDLKYLNSLNASDVITEYMILEFKKYLNM